MNLKASRLLLLLRSEAYQLQAKQYSIFTPLVFALVILIIQQMLWTDMPRDLLVRVFISEVFIAGILSVYLSLLSSFDNESEDGFFTVLRVWPHGLTDIFAVKVMVNWLKSISLLVGVSAAGLLFSQFEMKSLQTFLSFLVIISLSSLGMVAIGCLLVLVTESSRSRTSFLHLMFFPLILPVLIGGVESSRQVLEFDASLISLGGNWLGLVGIFNFLYLALGLLLCQESHGRVE